MFTTQTKILGLLLILLIVEACTPDTAVPATIPPTRTVGATETGTAVAQVLVTAVPTFSPTPVSIETPSMTPRPTNTPQPTLTPSSTPTPVFYSIPDWASDPAANVLLLHTSDIRGRENAVTVFNAQTGERFDIPVAEYVHPTWVEHEDGLYIHIEYLRSYDDPFRSAEELDIVTGELKRLEMPRVFTPGVRNISSPDGRYLIRLVEDENTPAVVTLINQETGEENDLTDPFNGEYPDGIQVEWTFDGQIVGVERFRRVEDPSASYGVRAEPALAVFSLDGTLLTQYHDMEHTGLKWSPVLPYRLLYPAYSLNEGPPCTLDVLTSEYSCLETVSQWREEQEVEIGIFNWAPDGSKIGFVYWGGTSGFCYVELITGAITCPVTRDDLQIEPYLERFGMEDGVAYLSIREYEWSPDSQYIALTVAPAPPPSDDGMGATVAVAEISGENLRVIVYGSLPYYNPWRPPIPSPAQE